MDIQFRKTYHLIYDQEVQSWKLEYEGADQPYSYHQTKEEALEAGRELARNQPPSQLVVHKMDGTVQDEFTYDYDF